MYCTIYIAEKRLMKRKRKRERERERERHTHTHTHTHTAATWNQSNIVGSV